MNPSSPTSTVPADGDAPDGPREPGPAAAESDARRPRGRLAGLVPSGETLLPVLLLAVLFTYFAIRAPYFLTYSNLTNLLDQASVLGIISIGAAFIMVAGGLDLSIGATVAMSGVVAALGMTSWTHSLVVGLLLGLGVGIAVGALNAVLVIVLRVPSFVATLGTLVLESGLALSATNNGTIAGLPTGFGKIANTTFLGLHTMVWITVGCFVAGWILLHHTVFGVKTFATGGNPTAGRLVGLRPGRVVALNFVICSFLASLAGIVLASQVSTAQPTIGAEQTLYAVAAVVLGGTSLFGGSGGIPRTALGVAAIAMVQNGLNLMGVIYQRQQVVIGVVFILGASPFIVAGLRRAVQTVTRRVAR